MIGAVAVVAQAAVQNSGDDASSRLSMAITGLLVLAGLILVATVIFWRMTRPERGGLATGTMRQIAPVPTEGAEAAGAGMPAAPSSVSSPPQGTAPPLVTRPTPPARPAPAAPPVRPASAPVAPEAPAAAPRPTAPRPTAPPVQAPSQAPVSRPTTAAPQDQGPTPVAPVRRAARRAGPDAVAG